MKIVQKWTVNKTWWHLKTNADLVIVSSLQNKDIAVAKIGRAEGVIWSTITKSKENKKSLINPLIPQYGEKEWYL